MNLGRTLLLALLFSSSQLYSIAPDAQQALTFFERINGDPNTILNKFYRATMLSELHEYDFALKLYDELLLAMPHATEILYNKAYTLKLIGRSTEALPLYRTIIKQNPHNQFAHIGLSHVLLDNGDYAEGFKEYEWRLVNKNYRQTKPINLQDLQNKTVFLYCESGLGDQIQCLRYAQLLKEHGAYIIAQTYKVLVPLFKRCPYLDQVITKETESIRTDFRFCYFSLPVVCNTTSEQTIPKPIPYFSLDQELLDTWKKKISKDSGLKIGLNWHTKIQDASFEFSPFRKRSIPLTLLAPLAKIPEISFYSLQRINGLEELDNLPANFSITVFNDDFDESHGSFMDTAALMQNLDLIITVDTSVAHLAGALGVRTWLLLPAVAEWRWQQTRSDCPWYPSMRLFRQKHAGNWEEVVEEVKKALIQFIKATR